MSHARLYIASDYSVIPELQEYAKQSADIEHFVTDALGIADARLLADRAGLRPVERATRDFVIQFKSATSEAQNALLKLLEEPASLVCFHVVVPREDILLPTVRSRLLSVSVTAAPEESVAFAEFITLAKGEQLAEISTRAKSKDMAWMEEIARGAEMHVANNSKVDEAALKAIVLIRQYLGSRGASNKMLLEELTLSL